MIIITPNDDLDFEVGLITTELMGYSIDVWDTDGDHVNTILASLAWEEGDSPEESGYILRGYHCDVDDGTRLEEEPTWWLRLADVEKIEVF